MIVPVQSGSQKGSLGIIVEVNDETFWGLLKKVKEPLVITVRSGVPKAHKYLTEYNGYYFMMKTKEPRDFSQIAEVIVAKKIHAQADWSVF